ncbi:hypothetical protein GF322_05325 [Candidatus Dependentiae bacterium]|nr:hypothetical protein [Candidatus Dependentiae bacterium]
MAKVGRKLKRKSKRSFVASSLILKGGAGKTFTVYMLCEYIREKLNIKNSYFNQQLDKVLVCDLDSQISLIGNFEGFKNDRRTTFWIDKEKYGEKLYITHKLPTENQLEEFDFIIIDNSPEYEKVLQNKIMILNTNIFMMPVNNLNALDRVDETINSIREIEDKAEKEYSEIVLIYIDTMHVHRLVREGIIASLKQKEKMYQKVKYHSHIHHTRKVSLAETLNEPLYKTLRTIKVGAECANVSKYIINKCLRYYGYKATYMEK